VSLSKIAIGGPSAGGNISPIGLILSTPTASTGLRAQWPVGGDHSRTCPVLQSTPIAPQLLASRALVFVNREPVTVFRHTEALMTVVGWQRGLLRSGPEGSGADPRKRTPGPLRALQDHEFFPVLRTRLGWSAPCGQTGKLRSRSSASGESHGRGRTHEGPLILLGGAAGSPGGEAEASGYASPKLGLPCLKPALPCVASVAAKGLRCFSPPAPDAAGSAPLA